MLIIVLCLSRFITFGKQIKSIMQSYKKNEKVMRCAVNRD